MIKCPKTGRAVPTGVIMDKKSFELGFPSGRSVQCPICREMHVWSKWNAWIEGNR
jgi:hypothetical protein